MPQQETLYAARQSVTKARDRGRSARVVELQVHQVAAGKVRGKQRNV
jgi:hypothetical protein